MKGTEQAQYTAGTSPQHNRDVFATEGQRAGTRDKDGKEDKGGGKGASLGGIFVLEGQRPDSGQTWPIGKWKFINVKRGTPSPC